MIDNFKQIKAHLNFESDDDYYFVQILMRSKDNPELGSNNRLIKTYSIKSIEELNKKELEIIKLCNVFNARAYIHFTKRSFNKVSLLMMKELCDRITNDQCSEINRVFNSASGNYNAKEKTFIIDIDKKVSYEEDIEYIMGIINYINSECSPVDDKKWITTLNTPNGYHIITKPFNVHQFKMKYAGIDIHKNNPTILYTP